LAVMEFQVTTDLAPVVNTQIETNFEAVRDWLTNELAPYATMVVTPDAISDAKKTRANIRKVGESIDSQRKAIKKEWMKPYEAYEAKCKELTGIVSEAVSNIDGQIKAMENEEKEAKRQRLSEFFDENSYDVADFVTFDDLFDPKWLNATFSEDDAKNIISSQIMTIGMDLNAIRAMHSQYEAVMLSEYGRTHSLSKAMAEGNRLEAIQKAAEERKAKEAETTFSEPEVSVQPATDPSAPPIQATSQSIRPVAEPELPKPKIYTLRFEVELTKEQAYELKYFFAQNNIKYYKI